MADYKNISVRLNDEDYKKLEALTDFFNKNSYFKGSFADTLRISLNDKYTEVMKSTEKDNAEVNRGRKKRQAPVTGTAQLETATTQEESDVPEGQMAIDEVVGNN